MSDKIAHPARIRIRIAISCSVCLSTNILLFVDGRIPSQNHGASIRPSVGRIPSLKHEASIRPWTNTLSNTWGKYSSMDEYPLTNMGQAFVCGRILSQKHGAGIRPRTNTSSKTWASIHTRTNTLSKHGQVLVWTNTLSKTRGMDE